MIFKELKSNGENVASIGISKAFDLAGEIGKNYFSRLTYLNGLDFFETHKSAIMQGLGTPSDSTESGLPKREGLLLSAIKVCETMAVPKRINIELSSSEALVAEVNPALLEQAIVNFLDNAIKYSDEGGTIQVEATQIDTEIIISVTDHGCGIDKEHLPRIFERFYRVDKARSRQLGGTGLGLAIVKHITQAHGGRVSVESTPGNGSTFEIHMPRA